LNIDGYGKFEAYANRDSLSYREVYGLADVKTMYRGTIRKVGFSRAWHVFVQLGMTDDSYQIEHSENLSYREFVNLFLPYHPSDSVELKFRHALKIDQDDIIWDKYLSLDIFSKTKKIGLKNASPAQALQKILMDNWTLAPEDKDMIVMCHKFGYELDGQEKQIDATMVVIGEDNTFTAMSKTVGLPVGIAALAILNGEICTPGVVIPVKSEVYNPVMTALENEMISFNEKEVPYTSYNTLHL
jgi:saccharopine dehydrogenase-like NADP-dependent oxidoreductase